MKPQNKTWIFLLAATLTGTGCSGSKGGAPAANLDNITPSANIQSKIILKKANSAGPGEVDFGKFNPALKATLDAVTANDDVVSRLQAHFDETVSDSAQEQLKFDLVGSVRQTPWSSSETQLKATTLLASDRDSQRPGIRVGIDLIFQTDVLAAIRYSGKEALRTHSPNSQNKFLDRENAELTRLSECVSIVQLNSILNDAMALAAEELDDQIKKNQETRDRIAAGEKPKDSGLFGSSACNMLAQDINPQDVKTRADCVAYYDNQVLFYKRFASTQKKIVISTVSVAGSDEALSIEGNDLDGGATSAVNAARPQEFHVVISSQRASAELIGFSDLGVTELDKLKSTVQKDLAGFYSDDGHRKKNFQEGLRKALVDYKAAIKRAP